jgi:hypothetical protein
MRPTAHDWLAATKRRSARPDRVIPPRERVRRGLGLSPSRFDQPRFVSPRPFHAVYVKWRGTFRGSVLRVPHMHSGKKPIEPFSSFRPPRREWVRGQGRLHGRTPVPSTAASDRGAVWRIRSTWPSQQLRSRLTPPKWAKKGPHRESPHWASNNSLVNPCPCTLVLHDIVVISGHFTY